MGLIESAFRLGGSVKEARSNERVAKDQNKRNMELIKSLDYEPMYASQTTPQYQKTQSPIARAYLESFLAGNNPDMTFSGAPNAQRTKANQQSAQDAMFGTMQDRIAQQRAAQQNPYIVQTPTRKVVGAKGEQALSVADNPALASEMEGPISKPLADALRSKGWVTEGGANFDSPMTSSNINQLMMAYGGDQTAATEALTTLSPKQLKAEVRRRISEAGGLGALRAKYPEWTTRR